MGTTFVSSRTDKPAVGRLTREWHPFLAMVKNAIRKLTFLRNKFRMEGPPNALTSSNTAELGMIPRTVQQIFETAEQLKSKGWIYAMEGQFLEIYNETLRDLLSEEKEAKAEWGGGKHGGGGDVGKKYEIRHLPGGKTVVEGAVVGEFLGFSYNPLS